MPSSRLCPDTPMPPAPPPPRRHDRPRLRWPLLLMTLTVLAPRAAVRTADHHELARPGGHGTPSWRGVIGVTPILGIRG